MTIARAYPAGWGVGEKLTSAQENQLDLNTTYALDKRTGEVDSLESVVSSVAAGRIIPTVKVGANANSTYVVADGIQIIRIPTTITGSRSYTLDDTGAVDGDSVFMTMETPATAYSITVKDSVGTVLFVLGLGQEGYEASFVFKAAIGWKLARGRRSTLAVEAFTASGSWVCPRGVKAVLAYPLGGGGGGGGGATSGTGTDRIYNGGGGGGGAIACFVPVSVTPGSTYTVTVGNGGAGGSVAGSNGGDTSFALSGSDLAVSLGGQGGQASTGLYGNAGAPSSVDVMSRGGMSRRTAPALNLSSTGTAATDVRFIESTLNPSALSLPLLDGQGGYGAGRTASTNGAPQAGSPFAGGTGGTTGTDSGSARGGGGGGGGGGGMGGNGGAGGNGGNGNNAGVGTAGANGQAASANSGAGGGGAGGGGSGSASGSSGGIGGAGGSGGLYLVYVIQGE